MIAANPRALARRARKWQTALRRLPQLSPAVVQVIDAASTVGGGSLPGQTLPTKALALAVSGIDGLAARLRHAVPPVIARIDNERLLFDPRTVLPEQDRVLVDVLQQVLSQ
jgi:L-seryl-tRNA(Ser) seleniumtransferase